MKTNIAIIESDSVIVSMTRASLALAEAVTISHTKTIVDVARAAEIYAKRHLLSDEAIGRATSVKVEATRKLGEILLATPKASGTAGIGRPKIGDAKKVLPKSDAPTLEELGLTPKESALAQKIAGLSEEAFEQVRTGAVTMAKAVASVKANKEKATPAPSVAEQKPDVPDDFHISEADLLTEMQETQDENKQLLERVEIMSKDDKAAEIGKLLTRIAGLEGRIKQLMMQVKTSADGEKYHATVIHKLRKILGVEGHKEIVAAVTALVADQRMAA